MLLAVDVSNRSTVIGAYKDGQLLDYWRISTTEDRTSDEYCVLLQSLFSLSHLNIEQIEAGVISSVVPGVLHPLSKALRERFKIFPMVVGPGIKTGMPILYENPKEVGADRIVNAVAAYDKYKAGTIVVDFGTATTFDCITPKGEYLGGVIAPGLGISADALYRHTAKLPRVEIQRPGHVIGRNTVASIQSGLYYGCVGLVDGIVHQICQEIGYPVRVVATGGLSKLIVKASATIEEADELLTLTGLKLIFNLNRA